jgi:putative CocE/NonD family hydrolase
MDHPPAAAVPETVAMTTHDGVRLDADLYRPAGSGPWPVLLMRQPYGRRIANTLCYAHPSWYAAQGYLVVVQDVRGRGTSEGVFRTLESEAEDGAETIAWAAALPGSSGRVGMYGFSYQGTAQLLAAIRAASPADSGALRAIAPAMIGWDMRRDWAYENDAFLLQGNLGWATQIAAESARHGGDRTAHAELFAITRNLPLYEPVPARPAYIERYRALTHYHAWLDEPADSPYWARISPSASADRLAESGPAMLFIGGWYDSHLPGTLAAYRRIAAVGRVPTRAVIGPWTHFPWDRKVGALDFGPEAVTTIDLLQLRWFDRWLKDILNGVEHEPAVRLFDLGTKAWRDFAAWPDGVTAFYPTAGGRAAVAKTDGQLRLKPGAPGTEWLVHDPWRPAPSLGGAFGAQPGPTERGAVDARSDVLAFTTPPLEAPLSLAGDVDAELFLVSDAPSFDIGCVLSRVSAGGQVFPIASGYRHLRRHDPAQAVTVPLRACCATLLPGEALRLSLSAAAFPAFPVNPGTGADPTQCGIADARIIQLGLRHGGDQASRILLPVIS